MDYYLGNIDSSQEEYSRDISDKPLRYLKRYSFALWFPVQKTIARGASHIRVARRDHFISPVRAKSLVPRLEPGDIMLQRREWRATNVGIPGFWTHTAMYVGSPKVLDGYFSDLPELNGLTFSTYLKKEMPDVFSGLMTRDKHGYFPVILEGLGKGVVLEPIEVSANADSLAVLRPKRNAKQDMFKVLIYALRQHGKPYDFYFDFVSDEQLMCSEIVYNAYKEVGTVSMKLKPFSGGLIYFPNDFAEKFDKECNSADRDLELIFFLDGNERNKSVTEKDAQAFRQTWKRPKWHVIGQYFDKQR